MIVTLEKASALAIGNTQALRGHLRGQTPVDNVIFSVRLIRYGGNMSVINRI
ncbi:TPA: hypothetical protein ACJIPQ_002037 [Klebsiella pneumoniae]